MLTNKRIARGIALSRQVLVFVFQASLRQAGEETTRELFEKVLIEKDSDQKKMLT